MTPRARWPQRALVMGMRVSGEALARALTAERVEVRAVDDAGGADARARAAASGVRLFERPDAGALAALVAWCDWVVLSPGIPPHHPVHRLAAGKPVVGELELGGRLARVPMIAVTGTNGKSTVTTLVESMLLADGRRARAIGNLGTPLVEAVAGDAEVLVVEVSSFQLAATVSFHPAIGTWLNLAPDHLDWHASMDDYIAAKARIWACQEEQDVAVANAEDPVVMREAADVASRVVTFGLDRGDWHEERGRLVGPGSEAVMDVAALWRGLPSDRRNALAAIASADAFGVSLEACAEALRSYRGLPHRVALVAEIGGVAWYDDSKATTPDATLAAIEGFSSVVLLAGGRNKGLDLGVLRSASDRVRAVVAFGEAAPEVEAAFGAGDGPEVRRAGSMAVAVAEAASMARPGDVVLLSPACASFDWYRSYAERGEDFVAALHALSGPSRARSPEAR